MKEAVSQDVVAVEDEPPTSYSLISKQQEQIKEKIYPRKLGHSLDLKKSLYRITLTQGRLQL